MALADLLSEIGPGKGPKPYKGGKEKTPTGKSNRFDYAGGEEAGLESYLQKASELGLNTKDISSSADLQSRIYDSLMSSPDGRNILSSMWSQYGDTRKGSSSVLPENLSEQDLMNLKSSFVDDKLGARTQMILGAMKGKEKPPAPTQKEEVPPPQYVDPSSPYSIQVLSGGDQGKEVLFFPKNIDDWRSAMGKLRNDASGAFISSQERGNNGQVGAQANFQMSSDAVMRLLKDNPQMLSMIGDGYVRNNDKNVKFVKQSEAEKKWDDDTRNAFINSGFTGDELERIMQRELSRNPYRTKK